MVAVDAIVKSAFDPIVLLNDENIITLANSCCCRLFDYNENELVGKNVLMLFAAGECTDLVKSLQKNGSKTNNGDSSGSSTNHLLKSVMGRKSDGNLFEVDVSLSECEADDGTRIVAGIMRKSISKRESSGDGKYDMMKSAVNPMMEIDDKGVIIMVNPACCQTFLYEEKDLIGNTINILLDPDEEFKIDKFIGFGGKFHGLRRNQSHCLMFLTVSEILSDGDGGSTYLGILRDISDDEMRRERKLAVVSSAIDPIFQIDYQGIIQMVNRACCKSFLYLEEELVGRNISILIPSDENQGYDSCIENYIKTGDTKIMCTGRKFRARRKDGSCFPIFLTMAESKFSGESFHSGIIRDISAEEVERERMMTMFKTCIDPILEIDASGTITMVNPQCCKVFMYDQKDIIGEKIKKLIPENFLEECAKKKGTNEIGNGRKLYGLRMDGSVFPILLTVTESRVGAESRYISILRDLTKEQEERERMMSIVSSAIDPIVQIDKRGIITMVNPACRKVFMYDEGDLIGKNVSILMPPEHERNHDGYMQNYFKTGKTKIIGKGRKLKGLRSDGTTFPLFLSISRAEIGDEVFFTGILRDMTAEEQERERMTSMILSAVDPIVQIDDKGIMTMVNPACCNVFQYEENELLGKNVKMLMPTQHQVRHDGYLKNYQRTGAKKIIGKGRKLLGRKKDGSMFALFLTVSEAWIGDKQFFTGILRDLNAFHSSSYNY